MGLRHTSRQSKVQAIDENRSTAAVFLADRGDRRPAGTVRISRLLFELQFRRAPSPSAVPSNPVASSLSGPPCSEGRGLVS